MEFRQLFLCCALFTIISAFRIPERVAESSGNDLLDLLESEVCKCKNGRCVTDHRGKKKCNCLPGFALQDDSTCERCDCGKKGRCMFVVHPKSAGGFLYEKKCLCDQGSAEKEGKCIDCHCGENSKCEFEGDEKICYCIENYSEKDGVCTKCDCGFYGECKFELGKKICTCDAGYLEFDGYCKDCDCGESGTCSLGEDGEKMCSCFEGFRSNEGVCEKCDCGDLSVDCAFKEGRKSCICKSRAAQYEDRCIDCNCGNKSNGCKFINDKKICDCFDLHVQKGDTCKVACDVDRPCHNGGYCKKGICKCLPDTRGDFCEIIDECDHLCPDEYNVQCAYDPTNGRAFCKCVDESMGFFPETKQCRPTCDEYSRICENGGKCIENGYSKFCQCLRGTEGDYCEKVIGCYEEECGTDAICVYDTTQESAVCKCYDGSLTFDPVDKRCKTTCDDYSRQCENGGECIGNGYSKFCRCLEGTEGYFCEKVVGCYEEKCGIEARCEYDVEKKSADCKCYDASKSFNPEDRECKRMCQDPSDCVNGGTCTGVDSSHFCRCLDGTKGDFCEDVPGCAAKDCGHNAKCMYDTEMRMAVCVCDDYRYAFDPIDYRCKKTCDDHDILCQHGGHCSFREKSQNNFCECKSGTTGDLCEIVNECEENPDRCGDGSECIFDASEQQAICKCPNEDHSYDSVNRKCRRTCDSEKVCQNGGSCHPLESSYFCECLPGVSGDLCEVVVECEKELDRCEDGSKCSYDIKEEKVFCECPDEKQKYDSLDRKCKNTCNYDADCKNGGICMHRGSHLFCHCRKGISGMFCDVIDDCQRGICGDADKTICMYNIESETVSCHCKDSNEIYDPTSKECKACDCGKNSISCRIEMGEKLCTCEDGFESEDGTCKKKWCTEKNCFQGKCEVIDNEEVCSCYEGYVLEKDYCTKLNCSTKACINGTCIVKQGNIEQCVCPAGFTLNRDTCIRGVCRIDTCFGGRCQEIDGELMCVCPDRFHLEGIGCFETVCTNQHCFGGKCVVENDEEICTCPENHILVRNVCKRILCEEKNCFGGQCHIVDGAEVCTCPPGFSLFNDVCREDQQRRQ